MEKIIGVQKSFNGLQVSYMAGDQIISELFSYENLIEMKINVSDLVGNPSYYALDKNGPKIVRTDFCGKHDECKD
ncbi:hypothetical protein J2128_000104 [Methanomicrobium sp. W14]|uniref:hypothetical protein n=1 Tax=Methanomicrobium sp. W14 TaxID=2817839 RepID=UPI001AE5FF43|nr:hypothetical protein [Methanomicrobium sp. W14]MBP2132183.1 hypothetical protein [Methanomicrobium sp. W14]